MERERESFLILYTGYLLSIVKIKKEIERERERVREIERERKRKREFLVFIQIMYKIYELFMSVGFDKKYNFLF